MDQTIDAAHLHKLDTWNSGGGMDLDILELDGGLTFVIGEDTVAVYHSTDDFWAEVEDQDESRRTVTLLRETGQPFEVSHTP
jgi:hypothetical protein